MTIGKWASALTIVGVLWGIFIYVFERLETNDTQQRELTSLVRSLQKERQGLKDSLELAREEIKRQGRAIHEETSATKLALSENQERLNKLQASARALTNGVDDVEVSSVSIAMQIAEMKRFYQNEQARLENQMKTAAAHSKATLDHMEKQIAASAEQQKQDKAELSKKLEELSATRNRRKVAELESERIKEENRIATAKRRARLAALPLTVKNDLKSLTTPGYYRLPNRKNPQPRPVSLTDLRARHALNDDVRGLKQLAHIANNRQNDRPRFAGHMYRGYTNSQRDRVFQLQKALIDYGEDMVALGWLSK